MASRKTTTYTGVAGAGVVISVLISAVYYPAFNLLSFINSFFLVSLMMLIVGGLLSAISSGFFDGMVYSFKRFFRKGTKWGELMVSDDEDDYPKGPHQFSLTKPLLIIGGILFVATLALSYTI